MSQKVAVIAVHGVGQHPAGASAEAVANLLVGLNCYAASNVASPYSSFSVNEIDVPLPSATLFRPFPPKNGVRVKESIWKSLSNVFEERRGAFVNGYTLDAWFSRAGEAERKEMAELDVASEFMKIQVEDYKGDPATSIYSTCRLEGRRDAADGELPTDVHVYEMHWSDLSSPNNSFLRFFMAFYQLILHLSSLGRIAVDQVALEHMRRWDWFVYQRTYSYANRALTLLVFNLLVVLPVVAFAPVVLLLPEGPVGQGVAVTLVFAGMLGGLLICSQVWPPPFGARHWWPTALGGSLIGAAISWTVFHISSNLTPLFLTIEWWCVAILVLGVWVFPNYDQVRNGELQAGWGCVLVAASGFFLCLHGQSSTGGVALQLKVTAFKMLQYVLLALRFSWIVFTLLAVAAFCMERVCRLRLRGAENRNKRARACSAARTGRLTLALSSILLMLVSIFLWCGIYHYFAFAKKVSMFSGVIPQEAYIHHFELDPDETDIALRQFEGPDCKSFPSPQTDPNEQPRQLGHSDCKPTPSSRTDPNRFFEGLLLQNAHPGLPFVMGFSTMALFLFMLVVLPSVYRELKPPLSATNRASQLLGAWLSSGLGTLRIIIALFWIAAFVVPVVYVLVAFVTFASDAHPQWSGFPLHLYTFSGMNLTKNILDTEGAIFAGSATLVVGLLLKYGSVVLDTILDVDNYLRTSPATSTPRARIVERYLALLHYLHDYRGSDDGRPYDRIVIVAHSLGSLITADLLRFLRRNELAALTKYAFADATSLPVYFFTMGNPLRQLLNRFFPTLYRWVRECPDGTGKTSPRQVPILKAVDNDSVVQEPAKNVTPGPAELGVLEWRNSYRSGDYVGRSLWMNDWYARTSGASDSGSFPETASAESFPQMPATCIESCVGLGAHTHYWDRTAPDIAQQLDALIAS